VSYDLCVDALCVLTCLCR